MKKEYFGLLDVIRMIKRENQIKINNLKNYEISDMHAIAKVSSSNKVVVPENFRKHYDITAGDEISWTNTEEGILLKIEKKVTEKDINGLIKKELPYNSVEIKKRGSKGLKL